MKKIHLFALVLFAMLHSSCGSFWDGMAAGFGSYGMGGGFTPLGYGVAPAVTPMSFPAYVPGVDYSSTPATSTPSSASSQTSGSSYSSSSNSRQCRLCLGTGKCQTCNGKGYYDVIGIGSGRHLCPNCASNHNGKCSSCNGSGQR